MVFIFHSYNKLPLEIMISVIEKLLGSIIFRTMKIFLINMKMIYSIILYRKILKWDTL